MSARAPLPRAFFARDADLVARDLLGRLLVHESREGPRVGRIVETEAYFGPAGANAGLASRGDLPPRLRAALLAKGDPASHSFHGPTARNRIMYGPAGHAYVYLIYGMYECLNVSTGREGDPQAVLFRAVEPVLGFEGARADGPGKLTRALGVTRADNGRDMATPPLYVAEAPPPARVRVTRRVNVVGAEAYPLRFVDAASPLARPPKPRLRGDRAKLRERRDSGS